MTHMYYCPHGLHPTASQRKRTRTTVHNYHKAIVQKVPSTFTLTIAHSSDGFNVCYNGRVQMDRAGARLVRHPDPCYLLLKYVHSLTHFHVRFRGRSNISLGWTVVKTRILWLWTIARTTPMMTTLRWSIQSWNRLYLVCCSYVISYCNYC